MSLALSGTSCTPGNGASASREPARTSTSTPGGPSPVCDERTVFETAAPGVRDEHRTASFWISKVGARATDPLMSRADIEAMNRAQLSNPELWRDPLAPATANTDDVETRWEARLAWMQERLDAGSYVEPEPGIMDAIKERLTSARPTDPALHVIAQESALWCLPSTAGLLSKARDVAFDRNRCSGLHPGELVLVTHEASNGWVHVESGHTDGWLQRPSWSAPMTAATARRWAQAGSNVHVLDDFTPPGGATRLRMGTSFPATAGATPETASRIQFEVPLATAPIEIPAEAPTVHRGPLPLTRAALLRLAFARMGDPYGWGGYRGGRDCSRLMFDVLASFGVQLARNSALQATMGAKNVSLEGLSDAEKLQQIAALNERNVVLIYMPGHIMLYLGEDAGDHFALSSLSEYRRPCDGGGAETVRLDRVEVTTLELGRGTERTAFIERLTRAIVFGPG